MEKKKRKLCFLITLLGVISIIVSQTVISIINDRDDRKIKFIEKNINVALNKCLNDKVCNSDKVTVNELIELKYLDNYFVYELGDYSTDSYVVVSSKEINLIYKNVNDFNIK